MATSMLSCAALLLLATSIGFLQLNFVASEYPDVIELVGYNSRRARNHFIPVSFKGHGRQMSAVPTYAPPPAKIQADIETVKQNIEKYNKLLTLDTKNLPESQKDMLERIVERVARLKESLDVGQTTVPPNRTVETVTATTETSTDMMLEAETDPTLVFDETTLLQLQTSMDELASAQASATAQTSGSSATTERGTTYISAAAAYDGSDDDGLATEEYESTTDALLTDVTDPDNQFVAARSNNRNIAAITAADSAPLGGSSTPFTTTAGNQRTLTTSAKAQKTRATKRPLAGTSTKATSSSTGSTASNKRVGGQRPGSSTVALHQKTTTKHKLAAATAALTTAQPNQKVKVQQQQKVTEKFSVTPATPIDPTQQQQHQRTPQGGTLSAVGGGAPTAGAGGIPPASYGAGSDMIYDPHVNTSAIIDSLNHAREEFYQQKHSGNVKDKKPSATAKPTKYHYYPHNQHIYLLPECAIQQVCNAVYVRLNYTQPLCACPSRYRDPCSASLNEDDQHTTKLVGDGKKKAITLAKTCEDTKEMRECRSPKDWSLLALQNTRTGKSHYLVICRCPDHFKMEGPMAHDQPTYASVPGIRVFGMMCVKPGFSVRKPSVQPPKRYQLQKPYYRPNLQSGGGSAFSSNTQYVNKDIYGRPVYGPSSSSSGNNDNSGSYHHHHQAQSGYQGQHHSNYQYLNRPEHSHSSSSNYHHSETLGTIGGFNGGGSIYGRNNERKGETPIQAAAAEVEDEVGKTIAMGTSTPATGAEARTTDNGVDIKVEETEAVTATAAAAPPVAPANAVEDSKREKRSLVEEVMGWEDESQMPPFPWDRVIDFQQSVVWA